MLKKLTAVAILLFCMHTAYAQLVKFSFGVMGGGIATLSDADYQPVTFASIGGGGGGFLGIKVGKVIGIQADARYSYQKANYLIEDAGDLNISSTQQYLHIPVCLQLWCSKGFAFEFGYQQSIALSGTLDFSDGTGIVEDKGILDYGSLVAGMVINMGKVVFLNLRYTKSLGYSYVMTTEPSNNMSLQIGLGFRLFNSRQSVFRK